MRIAVLSSFPDKKCGLADYTYPLIHEFKKNESVEKVIMIGDHESTRADYKVDFKSILLYKKVNEIIIKESIDLLYIGHEYWIYGRTNLGFILVHYKINIPVVTLLSVLTSTDPGVSFAERIRATLVERLVSKKANKIVVNSGISIEQLANIPEEKIEIIPLGISPKIRKYQNIVKTILFFGIVSKHKGVDNLIKASRYLKNIKIIIAGKPNMDVNKLLMLKNSSSGENEIIFDFDWISSGKKDKYFNEADMVVLPYTRIGLQSGVLYDALSYGLPCVVGAGSMMGSVVDEYQLGKVVDSHNPAEIAEGIKEIMNNYDTYQKNVFKYQKLASWESVAGMYMKVFQKVLEEI